ncbi:MAG: penicillin-binding protein activator [Burkholderiales bacterium]|nr:penicillin-binding protein activator [Burkholderiales bacterium]
MTAPPPVPAGVDIAVVLPLDAAAYARAADAVRSGVLAAAEAAKSPARIRVFAHGEDGVLAAFEAATQAGARIIIGPLLRDDVKVVATMALEIPYTIALNQIEDAATLPARLYTFPLSIESDARLIARRIREAPPAPNGEQGVAVVASGTPLMHRFATAFTAEWRSLGGSVPMAFRYDGTAEALTAIRRELARDAPAAVVLALDGVNAARAKPYLGSLPTYASALVFEGQLTATVRDLDGLVVTEIPWIVTPTGPEFSGLPRRDFPSAALTRLYALGLDAFRVASAFLDGPPDRLAFDGATGRITLEGHQLAREGRFAVFRDGTLVPVDGAR